MDRDYFPMAKRKLGEIGDGWYHGPMAVDREVINNAADIEISENNAVRVTWRITQHMRLPASYTRGGWQEKNWGMHRSGEYVIMDIVHDVTLARGERALKVKTTIENNAMDHRLRLRLPTGIEGQSYYASQPFCIISRATDERVDTANWKEYGVIEKNTTGIVAKYGPQGGFAFISNYGLHECGVSSDGNIDITLFRAFCQTVGTRGEIDGELLQKMTFSYTLLPLDADTPLSVLARTQDIGAAGLSCYTIGGSAACAYRPLLAVEGDAFVYSTATPLDDGIEVRLYNCSDAQATGTLTVPSGYDKAERVELDGRHIAALPITDGKVALDAPGWRIVTVKFSK
jgi:alpha-mannosidase